MERSEEILEIVREIRQDIAYMRRHRNMLCGTPILEVSEVCDLLKMSDRQLRRYCTRGELTGFNFGRRLMFSSQEITCPEKLLSQEWLFSFSVVFAGHGAR